MSLLIKDNIACVNWVEQFPYCPQVSFELSRQGERLLLRYEVEEQFTRAVVDQDNGRVWCDSCVEFFVAIDERGYYNFEFNSIGRGLIGYREVGLPSQRASVEVLANVVRRSSLGLEPFELRENCSWSLEVEFGREAFFAHQIGSIEGLSVRANFYKCGDDLPVAHYVSWAPIIYPTPSFHQPQFFKPLIF